MRSPWFVPFVIVALLAALLWLSAVRLEAESGAEAGTLSLAAQVRADVVTVTAPRLSAAPAGAASAASPSVAGVIVSVETSEGEHVDAGQVIARLDDSVLALRTEQARAAARGAWAKVGVIDSNLDTLADKSSQLADTRRQLDTTLRQVRAQRAEILANLAQARAAAASAPATLPPGVPDPRIAVAKLEAALAQIDAGVAKITAGRAKLESGSATIADARSMLRGTRDVATLAAQATDIGVDVAAARRALAVIRAPYDGVVISIAEPGQVVFAGGPVARLLPDGPLLLDAYADADQVRSVKVGSRADASADSWPGRTFPGRVTAIAPLYEYPPTTLSAQLVHMTRAFKVTVSVDDTRAPLPPGTPADLTIATRSK